MLETVKTKPPHGGGLRPVLTASARDARIPLGRDGETALGRTEKLYLLDSKSLI